MPLPFFPMQNPRNLNSFTAKMLVTLLLIPQGTMASADFLQFVVTAAFGFSYFPSARPPRVSATAFLPRNRHIYRMGFGQHWTSCCLAHSSVLYGLLCDFCSSVREFARQHFFPADIRLPSDSTSRWTPLPSANASYCRARCGLSPLSCCSCRAHIKTEAKPISFASVEVLLIK